MWPDALPVHDRTRVPSPIQHEDLQRSRHHGDTLLFCKAPALLLRIQASSEPSLLPRRPLLTLAMLLRILTSAVSPLLPPCAYSDAGRQVSRNRFPVLVDLQATASCLNHSILVPPWTGSPPYDAVSLRNCRPVRPSSCVQMRHLSCIAWLTHRSGRRP